jgi:hypothetical protein
MLDHVLAFFAGIKDQVVHAHGLDLLGERGKRVETVGRYGQGGLLFLGDLRHGLGILGGRGVDERPLIGAVRDAGFDERRVLADQNDRHARGAVHDLFHDGSEFRGIASLVGHGNGVDAELLSHAVDL